VADGSIEKLIVADGHVYVGGLAVSFNGKVRRLAAALDDATGVANAWNPRGTNLVSALAVSGNAVFLGGQFTSAGGQPRADIAALDPVTGDALPWNPGATMSVDALAVVGNTLYAGGQFTTIGGQLRDRIAALNATDGTVLPWNPGSTSTVTELVSDGTTLYAGNTSTIAGQTRNGLAAFDVATGNLQPWDPNLTGGAVATVALRGATVLAGGDFTSAGVQTRNRAAAIDTNGNPTAWDPNAPAGSSTPTVRGLADAGDRILAAGTFTTIGGAARSYLAALDPATGADLGWSPAPNGFADAVAASGSFVYAAGMFTTIGGNPRRGVAAFCRAPAPTALAAAPGANQVDLAWSPTGAAEYRVYRALAAAGPFPLIGTTAVPAFTDLTVEGGVTYYYRVSAFDVCESPYSNTVFTTPAGSCQLPPVFEGLAWAEQGTGGTCSVSLGWAPATAPCGGAVFYSVYRNTSPTFVPSPADLVATVSAGTTYTDATPLVPGTTYYYVVRATSQATQLEDANLFRRAVTPASCTPGAPGTVEGLTVTARSGQNVLQWVNPPGFGAVRIRYTSGVSCTPPTDPLGAGTLLVDDAGLPGEARRYPHTGLSDGTTYCYALFVDTGSGTWSARRTNSGRPFPPTGAVQWAFSSGIFSTAPPTVGGAGVIATNNAGDVHAMARGPAGGEWPAGWKPVTLGGPVQDRSPVVPIPVGSSNPVAFLGAQDGRIYAVDASVGGAAATPPWAGPAPLGGVVQAAPAGIFTAFGGTLDDLLAGTRDAGADNAFVALDPASGSEKGRYQPTADPDRMGMVSGMASVDYVAKRAYFASRRRSASSTKTLWCLRLDEAPNPVLSLAWARNDLGDIDSSPVLRGGRVYVGSAAAGGTVYSIDAAAGDTDSLSRSFNHADGQVKGFIFPDRKSAGGEIYFSTDNLVWVVQDDGSTLTPKYPGISLGVGVTPSPVLHVPGSGRLYVGGSDGRLYEIDVSGATPVVKPELLGDGTSTVGAPSYDKDNQLVHVGSAAGIFYAVQVPLP
jgi:PQQ-like domain